MTGEPDIRPLRLALLPIPMILGAVAVAAGAGVVAFALLLVFGDGDGYAALGYAVYAAFLAAVVAGVGSVRGLYLAARRAFPVGARFAPVVVGTFAPAGMLAVAAVTGDILLGGPPRGLLYLTGVIALAAPSLAFVWYGGPAKSNRRLRAVPVVALVVAGLGSLLAYTVWDQREDEVVAALPLVLFERQTLDPNFPDWHDPAISTVAASNSAFASTGHEVSATYQSSRGNLQLIMRTDTDDCRPAARRFACSEIGTLDGGELRLYVVPGDAQQGSAATRSLVLVYPDSSSVSIELGSTTQETAERFLAQLRHVGPEDFEKSTTGTLALTLY